MNKYSESYLNNGTAYISIDESPLSNDDLEKLNMFCSEVDKEFIEIGDAGEPNHLLVGRFMTDIDKPEKVNNNFSEKVIEILSSKKVINFIQKNL